MTGDGEGNEDGSGVVASLRSEESRGLFGSLIPCSASLSTERLRFLSPGSVVVSICSLMDIFPLDITECILYFLLFSLGVILFSA